MAGISNSSQTFFSKVFSILQHFGGWNLLGLPRKPSWWPENPCILSGKSPRCTQYHHLQSHEKQLWVDFRFKSRKQCCFPEPLKCLNPNTGTVSFSPPHYANAYMITAEKFLEILFVEMLKIGESCALLCGQHLTLSDAGWCSCSKRMLRSQTLRFLGSDPFFQVL